MLTLAEFQDLAREILTGNIEKLRIFLATPHEDNVVPYTKLFYLATLKGNEEILQLFLDNDLPFELDLADFNNSEYLYPADISRADPGLHPLSSPKPKIPTLYFLWSACSIDLFQKTFQHFALNLSQNLTKLQDLLFAHINGHVLYELLGRTALDKIAYLLQTVGVVNFNREIALEFFGEAFEVNHQAILSCFNQLSQDILQPWLKDAIELDNSAHVELLIQLGADVNTRTNEGLTPFLYACQISDHDLAIICSEYGADLTVTDSHGNNGLHLLLNSTLELPQNVDREGYINLDLEFFAWLLKKRSININDVNHDGATPLIFACNIADRYEAITTLLKYNPDYTADKDGDTPLHHITRYPSDSDIEIAQILVGHYSKSILNKTNQQNQTPFLSACFHLVSGSGVDLEPLHDMLIFLLERGSDVNHSDTRGLVALHYLATTGDYAGLEILLKVPGIKVSKFVRFDNDIQRNALDFAIEGNTVPPIKIATVRLLHDHQLTCQIPINKLQCDVLLRVPRKPIPEPVKHDPKVECLAIKKLVLQNKLNEAIKKLRSNRHQIEMFLQPDASILMLAVLQDLKFVKTLLHCLQNLTFRTPHQSLLQKNIEAAINYLVDKKDSKSITICDFLKARLSVETPPIASSADPILDSAPKISPPKFSLHQACARGLIEETLTLLQGCDEKAQVELIQSRDERGYTPLHYACENANEKLIYLLLKNPLVQFSICTKEEDAHTTKAITPLRLLIAAASLPIIHKFLHRVNWHIEPPYYELKLFTHWKPTTLMDQIIQRSRLLEESHPIIEIPIDLVTPIETVDTPTTADDLPLSTPSKPTTAVATQNLAVGYHSSTTTATVPVQFIPARPSVVGPFTFFMPPLPEVAQITFPNPRKPRI